MKCVKCNVIINITHHNFFALVCYVYESVWWHEEWFSTIESLWACLCGSKYVSGGKKPSDHKYVCSHIKICLHTRSDS